MARAQRRIYIAPGIWRAGDRLWAEVRIGSSRDDEQPRSLQDFPLGTDVIKMQAWQLGARKDLLEARPTAAARGTLAADVPIYLKSLPDDRYKADSAAVFAHWIKSPLGDRTRNEIERLDVIKQLAAWIDAGVAVSTTNKRLSRLRKLFQTLDGITTPNPTTAIKFKREPEAERRDIPVRIVNLILSSLPDRGRAVRHGKRPAVSLTKIRLTVMAWTGIGPATLRRVRARDLELAASRVYLRPRRKGNGSGDIGSWVKLLPPAVDAFRAYAAAGLFGVKWSQSSMRKTWAVGLKRAAAAAARHDALTGDTSWSTEIENLPPRCKPYDLRHAFASEMYLQTGDLAAVAELLQHANLETTKRYTKGAVSARVAAAVDKARAAYEDMATLPASAGASSGKAKAKRKHALIGIVRTVAS